MSNLYSGLAEKINSAACIALISHVNPDCDAICSSAALQDLLSFLKKESVLINDGPCPDYLRFLLSDKEIFLTEDVCNREFDLVISIDCAGADRAGMAERIIEKADFVVNIDHHATNTMFGDINIVEEKSAATGIIIYDMLKWFGYEMKKNTAEFLYSAIASDTGNFSYSNVDKRVFDVAGEIVGFVDVAYMSKKLFREATIKKIKLTGMAFENMKIYAGGRIAVVYATRDMYKKTGTASEDSEALVGYARDIDGVEVALFLRDTDTEGLVKVSMRSNSEFDAAEFCQRYGGGGHKSAAGCSVHGNIEEIKSEMINSIIGELK